MNVKKYFIVKDTTLLGPEQRLMYFGMYGFASTSPSPYQIDKLGFDSSKAALDRLESLSELYGSESVHGCYVAELQAFLRIILFISHNPISVIDKKLKTDFLRKTCKPEKYFATTYKNID